MAAIKLCGSDMPATLRAVRMNFNSHVEPGCRSNTQSPVTFLSVNLISLLALCFNISLTGAARQRGLGHGPAYGPARHFLPRHCRRGSDRRRSHQCHSIRTVPLLAEDRGQKTEDRRQRTENSLSDYCVLSSVLCPLSSGCYGIARFRTRQAPLAVGGDPGHRALQRRPGARIPHPGRSDGDDRRVALSPETGVYLLSVGNGLFTRLPNG